MITNKLIYLDSDFMLACVLKEKQLQLILFDLSEMHLPNEEQVQKYYYKKVYTNQDCPKSQMQIFSNIDSFFKVLQILKTNKSIFLKAGIIQIQIQILFETVSKSFQLEKMVFGQMQQLVIKTSQYYLQQIKNQAHQAKNQKIREIMGSFQQYKMQYKNFEKEKDEEIIDFKQQIQILNNKITYLKEQLKNIQNIHIKHQCYSQNNSQSFYEQSKKIKKQQKISQKLKVVTKQKKQSCLISQTFQKNLTRYLKKNLNLIKEQIQQYSNVKKLDLKRNLQGLIFQFYKQAHFGKISMDIVSQFNIKNMQILDLETNNIGDQGWESLLKFQMPTIQELYIGNNNLQHIKFNTILSGLKCLKLANSSQTIQLYPNLLSKQSVSQITNVNWTKLQILTLDIKQYKNQFDSEIGENKILWNLFIQNRFVNFNCLKMVEVFKKNIEIQTCQRLKNSCNLKQIKLEVIE